MNDDIIKYGSDIRKIFEFIEEDDWQKALHGEPDFRKRLLVDFDGVLHQTLIDSNGEITGDPVDGSPYWVNELVKRGFQIVVFTARTPDEFPSIRDWLSLHDFPRLFITNRKLKSLQIIDDRVTRFITWHDVAHLFI